MSIDQAWQTPDLLDGKALTHLIAARVREHPGYPEEAYEEFTRILASWVIECIEKKKSELKRRLEKEDIKPCLDRLDKFLKKLDENIQEIFRGM